jgi:hypothetical protein
MIYEIDDQIIAKIESIRLIAPELAKEAVSKGGAKVNDAMRNEMKAIRHNRFTYRNGSGNLIMYFSKNKTKTLGARKNGSPESMANFISNYFDEKNNLLVVGGMHKSTYAINRENGKIVGRTFLKGIGKHSYSMLHKMDTGERNEHHGWWSGRNKRTEPYMEDKNFIDYQYKRKGIKKSEGAFNQEINQKYDQQVKKVIMDVDTPSRKIV